MSHTIAIVEDDADQRENYSDALKAQGYDVVVYPNKPAALAGFKQALPDLAILDIMLEDEMDGGFDVCRELRHMSPKLPIIFLTARDSDIDRVSGLRLDAWDYITKPINLQFLGVRVASLFRIADSLSNVVDDQLVMLKLGDLELNEASLSVSWQGEPLNLTLTEFWVVESMAHNVGKVKSYDALMQVTKQSYVEKNTINGYIRRIRKKFKQIDDDFDHIETVFGTGYRWHKDD
ncbi:MAG: response regulator transcription factor [Arenicellales bacterium]